MSNIFTFNFNDAQQVLSIGAALPAVCIVFVSLRFYTRLLQKTKLGLDDWLIFCGLVSESTESGSGKHTEVSLTDLYHWAWDIFHHR